MRIFCFADAHVNSSRFGKLDPATGLNTRTLRSLALMNEVIDTAVAEHADALIFAGDAFRNATPAPTVIDRVAAAFAKASSAGIRTVVLDGNHDVAPMAGMVSGLAPLATLGVPGVIHTRTERLASLGDGLDVLMLPTHHTREDIEAILAKPLAHPTIVVGHLIVGGAALNDWTVAEDEAFIPLETFDRPNVSAVVLGHLHRHQVLGERPLVLYTGSTDRVDFGEEGQPKGYVVLNVDPGGEVRHEFRELTNAQRFVTVDVTSEAIDATLDVTSEIACRDLTDAVVRVRLTCSAEARVDEREVLRAITQAGATHLTRVTRKTTEETPGELSDEATVDVVTAVKEYFGTHDRAKERTQMATNVVNDVEARIS